MEFVAVKEEALDLYEREDEEPLTHQFDTIMMHEVATDTTAASTSKISLPLVPKIEIEEHNIMEQNEEQEWQGEHLPDLLSDHFMVVSNNDPLQHESFSIAPARIKPKNNNIILPPLPKIEGKVVFKCFHCFKYFASLDILLRHCKLHHFCKYCNKQFNNYDDFYAHNFEIHTSNDNCEICSKEFVSLQDRYMHISTHTYVCDYDYTDRDKYTPNPEILSKRSARKTACILCKNKIAEDEKHVCPKLVCMVCDLKYASIDLVVAHIKDIHLNQSKNCKHCKVLLEENDVLFHFEVCEALTKYRHNKPVRNIDKNMMACKYCKGIYYKRCLEKHIKLNHKCLMCGNIFPNNGALIKHMIEIEHVVYNNKKGIECQFCKMKYFCTNKEIFIKHLKNLHSTKRHNHTNCRICGDTIYDSYVSKNVHLKFCKTIKDTLEHNQINIIKSLIND